MIRTLSVALSLACLASAAKGHEFWIDPVEHQVDAGAPVVAALRVGQEYKGSSYSYVPRNFRRFDFAIAGEVSPVEGTIGDRPAANVPTSEDGLMVLIHATTDTTLGWSEWEKFVKFVEHKDAEWVLEAHAARGLTEDDRRELYSRYAKSLVAVGDGAGADFETGLLTEIVALENPYTDDMSDGIDVRVLYEGAPRAGTQIEVFEKAGDQSVEIFTVQTDADGAATVPVKPGYRYMLDSVVLREPAADVATEKNVQWESLWANLTFEVPGS
ncbi:MAG: DUF4198 domain-containing protein [Silicimonas sp.]|nr:DUF4198 domain-containing protein [Silicimonas sp.]